MAEKCNHPTPPLASSLKQILEILTIKLDEKRHLWISSEVTLRGTQRKDVKHP